MIDDDEDHADHETASRSTLEKTRIKGGRKKGGHNKVAMLIKDAIGRRQDEIVHRLFQLAGIDPLPGQEKKKPHQRWNHDGATQIAAIKTLLAYGFGRPTVHIQVEGAVQRSYVMEMPPNMEHEEWMKLTQASMTSLPKVINPNGNGNGNGNGHLGNGNRPA